MQIRLPFPHIWLTFPRFSVINHLKHIVFVSPHLYEAVCTDSKVLVTDFRYCFILTQYVVVSTLAVVHENKIVTSSLVFLKFYH